MTRPKLLELGGCEGASTAGWQRAGWDVTTVDVDANRLKYNPAETKIHKDALQVLASVARTGKFWAWGPFDAVSLHPPCQWYTRGRAKDRGNATKWERTIPPWRDAVEATGLPYVIENVADAGWDMRDPIGLCGCMFDLSALDKSCRADAHEDRIAHALSGACDRVSGVRVHLQRLRLFEANWDLSAPRACDHSGHEWVAGAYGGARRDKYEAKFIRKGGYVPADKATVKALLGVTHDMTWQGLFEAVPVPYTGVRRRGADGPGGEGRRMRTLVVHNLPPMTLGELAAINCGHCRHQLTYHITSERGVTQCAICHCLRSPGEDIRKPHNFSGGAA